MVSRVKNAIFYLVEGRSFYDDMLKYMLREHRNFLIALRRMHSLKDFGGYNFDTSCSGCLFWPQLRPCFLVFLLTFEKKWSTLDIKDPVTRFSLKNRI